MTNKVRKVLILSAVFLFLIGIIAIVACISCVGGISATAESPSISFEGEDIVCSARPYETGKVVVEQSSRRVLFASNENAKLYPASTTKVLTAMVVLDEIPLKTKVKIDSRAVGIEGSSIYLRAGEVLTVEDLLYGMMLRSGNDSAVALALAVSPTIEAFAEKMNEKAKECGAKNSNFVNPHGLHDEAHYTTAYDLALITAKGMENEDFRRIVSTKRVKIGEGESTRIIANKNKMLSMFDGANGVKTGYTKSSGRCLVSSAKRGDMTLISVVLNCPDMWRDSSDMLETCFEEYEMVKIEKGMLNANAKNEVEISVNFDKNGDFYPSKYPLKKDGSERISIVRKLA